MCPVEMAGGQDTLSCYADAGDVGECETLRMWMGGGKGESRGGGGCFHVADELAVDRPGVPDVYVFSAWRGISERRY